jgi:hypothetical protein
MYVARWQSTTALAIVQSASPPSILIGVLSTVYPLLLLYAMLGLEFWARSRREVGGPTALPVSMQWLVAVFAFFTVRWFIVAFFLVGFGLPALLRAFMRRRGRATGSTVPPGSWNYWTRDLIVYGLFVFLVATEAVWVPSEAIERSNGDVIIGYVIGYPADWVSVLAESDRTVMLVERNDVESRTVCDLRKSSSAPPLLAFPVREGPPGELPLCLEFVSNP